MILKEKIANRLVILEIIYDNKQEIKKQRKVIYEHYKNDNLSTILFRIENKILNSYVRCLVTCEGELEAMYVDLSSNDDVETLVDRYMKEFKNKEWYEACAVLKTYRDNI